jgi:predicted enzyme related to lactoylglutathione lyase
MEASADTVVVCLKSPPALEHGATHREGIMPQSENHHRIDYIEFPAASTEPIKKFYSTAFGWKFEDYGPGYTSFQDGRLAGGFDTSQPATTGPSALTVIYSSDLETTEKAVRDAGATITRAIFSFPGGRRFHFTDPSGNELAVWSDAS